MTNTEHLVDAITALIFDVTYDLTCLQHALLDSTKDKPYRIRKICDLDAIKTELYKHLSHPASDSLEDAAKGLQLIRKAQKLIDATIQEQ